MVNEHKMRKIVFIASNEWAPWGGSENLWHAAAERFARRGVEVWVSVKGWDSPVSQVEHLRSAGCQIVHRDLFSSSFVVRFSRRFLPRREYARRHVKKLGAGADLVVVSQGGNTDGLPWMEASRWNGYRYAVVAQAAAEGWWPTDSVAERLAECYEGASLAFFVSEANLALSRRQFVTPLLNGKVIRNPFNVPYDAKPSWPTEPKEELALACVGRLDVAAKGQDLLLQVLSLSHWRRRSVRLSLVGTGTNSRGLHGLVSDLRVPNVEFAGFVNNIEQLWRYHHALVLPSRYEGMPLALVEAMLCSRPCVVTDVAGHRELVRDGVNGFLARAPTVELLDEAMTRAWENRTRLREMGETAARDVRQWVFADPAEDFVRELDALVDRATV